jgi:hypothetical protein
MEKEVSNMFGDIWLIFDIRKPSDLGDIAMKRTTAKIEDMVSNHWGLQY